MARIVCHFSESHMQGTKILLGGQNTQDAGMKRSQYLSLTPTMDVRHKVAWKHMPIEQSRSILNAMTNHNHARVLKACRALHTC